MKVVLRKYKQRQYKAECSVCGSLFLYEEEDIKAGPIHMITCPVCVAELTSCGCLPEAKEYLEFDV